MAIARERTRARPASSPRWAGWLSALTLAVLWGLAAWIYQLTQGLAATGMRDVVSWGMYIFTFAYFVGLSAGGLIMASSAEVFGVRSLQPLSRLGVLTAAACVAVSGLIIIPDLGRPDRILNLFIHAHWGSPLIWDVTIITVYFVFSVVDLTVMTRRGLPSSARARTLRVLAYVGLPTAVLLHSITAWIFGLQIARSWWNTALMAPLFVTSAILSGTALVALVALAVQHFGRVAIPRATWRSVATLIAASLAVDLFLVGSDYVTILWGNVPREQAALDLILPGGNWQALFWLEWVVGGIIPFVLLVWPRVRERFGILALSSALVLIGVYAFRIELVVVGMVHPLLHFPPGMSLGTYTPSVSPFQYTGTYHPTWVEYSIVAGLVAFLCLLITLGYRWFNVMRRDDQEEAAR